MSAVLIAGGTVVGPTSAQLAEVRNLWQFYRDRRPDAYGPLVAP